MTTLDEVIASMPEDSQKRIAQRSAELIAEEKTLRELHRLQELTREHMAQSLGVKEAGLSLIEKRSDLYLSTLRNFIRAMGGELELRAKFPDRPPVIIKGLAPLEIETKQIKDLGAP